MTVPTPTVSACLGTALMSPPKNLDFRIITKCYFDQIADLALAMMVSWARVLTRVLDTRELPGSLKAM